MRWVFACLALSLSGCAAGAAHRAPSVASHPSESRPRESPPRESPPRQYVLDEPTAAEAARAMTMTSGPEAHDCDSNGIPDSLDVLAGRGDDVNHNGQDDVCDDDPAVRRRAWSDDWRQLAAARDTAALLVCHQSGDEVWIR